MESDLNRGSILIVDDTPENLTVLRQILTQNDYRVRPAIGGDAALRTIQADQPDLILLDIVMPGMDGYEVSRRLKADEKTRDIPIIFISALTEIDDKMRAFAEGGVDYITKPFQNEEVLARVRTQMVIREKNDTIRRQYAEQQELLHVLCHDLANPLGSVLSTLEILDAPEEFKGLKSALMAATQNGLDIIGLVRQLRQFEVNKSELKLKSVFLAVLIKESELILNNQLTAKNITLKVDVPADLTVRVETISFVNSVLNNLLTNAIKFSYSGSSVDISAQRKNEQAVLTIQDRGIGIPSDILADLFIIGQCTQRAGTEKESGTGFGMPLVKKFIRAYGGDIQVQSQSEEDSPENHGTTIILTLPVK